MPLQIVETGQLVPSTLVAFSTLLVYDYLCTFDRELAYVWTSPAQWSAGTVLFLLNRYLPFVDTFLGLRLRLTVSPVETCKLHFQILSWFIVLGIIISEAILLLRTYAIWERKRFILVILCVSSLTTFTTAIVATQLELRSIRFAPSPFPGCHIESASVIIIVAYLCLATSETIMAILTVIKAYRDLRYSQSRWVIQLYSDGLLFYLFLLMVSLANVFVPIFASSRLANWLATPQRVLHSVLTTRVLLSIFQQRAAAGNGMTNRAPHDARFTSFDDAGMSTEMSIVAPEDSMLSFDEGAQIACTVRVGIGGTKTRRPSLGGLKGSDDGRLELGLSEYVYSYAYEVDTVQSEPARCPCTGCNTYTAYP